jgi:CubicO group peptidase (beta-lactamase class C family)
MSPDPSGDAGATPVAGEDIADLAEFDRTMTALMARWELPGSQLAVTKKERLVFSHVYGLADRETGEPVRLNNLLLNQLGV